MICIKMKTLSYKAKFPKLNLFCGILLKKEALADNVTVTIW